MKEYGISAEPEGLQDWASADAKLRESRNYWICTSRPDGRPHAAPVWGIWHEGALYFGTGASSVKARNMDANPAVSVHLESGDDVVMFEGVAEKRRQDELPPEIDVLYREKYAMGSDEASSDAPFYVVRPALALTWLEKDFPATATRFTWE